jgi:bifunctional enzyme CysN/CysC
VLPSGFESTIVSIETADGQIDEAYPPQAVTVRLSDHLDVSRGDMFARPHNLPEVTQDLDAQLCWMDEQTVLTPGRTLALKHTTRWARVKVRDIAYRVNVNTLHRDESANELSLNEIGRATLRSTTPLFIDPYTTNRSTGAFILVDESSNRTVAAGMLR